MLYGDGAYDTLDFSAYSVDSVTEFNLADINSGGEVVSFNNNSDRVFDSLTLSNGSKFLFEGIDRIVFSDRVIDLTITPDDPSYLQQWNLHMIGVQNAWRLTTGSEDVLVGIQDSGLGLVEGPHPDLRTDYFYSEPNLADDFSRVNPGLNSEEEKVSSHGTSVQGIIVANSDNAEGIAGINWSSDVYSIDVLGNNTNTGDLDLASATKSMIGVAERENQNLVINLSLGKGIFTNLRINGEELESVVLANPNVLFVIAAGNKGNLGEGLDSPAILANYYDNVIAVGASWGSEDINGNPVNPGTRIDYSQYGEGLTVTAPSEVLTTNASDNGDLDYAPQFNGTSAATPHVTGVASLIWSANPELTAFEVKDIISQTAYDLGPEGYDIEYGSGLINADAAVRQAIALGRGSYTPDNFQERLREMLESFQERFPDANIEEIYDRFERPTLPIFPERLPGTNIEEIFDRFERPTLPIPPASSTNRIFLSSNNIDLDPFTGTNSSFSSPDSLSADDLVAVTDSNSISDRLIEELNNYNLGAYTTETLNSNEIDIIGAVNSNVLPEYENGITNIVDSLEEV